MNLCVAFRDRVSSRKEEGFSMLEILISLLILSIGLLGLASLQVVGLQNNHSAYLRSQATILSYEIVDSMRANRQAALEGAYNIDSYGDPPGGHSNQAVEMDLQDWWTNLRNALPDGQARVRVDGQGNVIVRVRWLDERRPEDVDGEQDWTAEDQRREFRYATQL
ncbi:type IV pilus modification protein PilV [Gammaproteobacteria bacterium AB-CW1]|uniref:Type IV pilus modification protein PilV n=1 Tax=Natronospira elongata TaxID=3110268 RepID=A0AAP6JH67_9GAMM|nr:type IV pilus modification protein PilV [Gammaproteobacteria bacterium AB-CW1]